MRDTRDERQVRIRLTDEGWALRAAASPLMDKVVCATGRSRAEADRLRTEINEVRHHMDGIG